MAINLAQLRQSKTYRGQAPEPQLLEDLSAIAGFDRYIETIIRRYQILFGCSAVAAIAAAFGANAFPPLVYLAAGLGIVASIAAILWGLQGRFNLSNYRYEFPQHLLPLLARDCSPSHPLDLILLFTSPTHRPKFIGKAPHPTRSGWKVQHFRDPWLKLQGEFLDGNQFALTVTERTQIASGWKRTRRGKYKHKRKIKCKGSELLLNFTFPRKRYGGMQVLQQDVRGAIQLPPETELKGVKADERSLQLKVKTTSHLAQSAEGLSQVAAAMFLSLYQILNLARMLSKNAP
ncbi:MAG: hypothetical protein AB4040_16290 [Synechococcus sp.]